MDRREFMKMCGLGTLALAGGRPAAAAERARKQNVVFILVDDLGWFDLGCYGSTFHETPNLDRLAASGMRFTNAYAACPVCSPTRAAIMTGKYPARLNITDWIPGNDPKDRKLLGPQDEHQLPLQEATLAEVLRGQGYRTFFAGKWHLGDEGFFPEDQGFEINKGGHHKGSPPGGYYTPYKNPKLEDGPPGEYLTDRLTDESIGFLRAHGDEPFLLYLSFYTVHTPIQACKRHLARFEEKAESLPAPDGPAFRKEHDGTTRLDQNRADYATMVHAMDENVGRLLDTLDELGLAEDTIVVFTSDNGGLSTVRGEGAPTSIGPLRAGKGWCYEGGIRIPQIMRVPRVTQPGSTCDVPVVSTDFYPTLLELLGVPMPDDEARDGVSLAALLGGGGAPGREAIFWHYPHYHGSTWTPGAAVRAGDWKLIEFYDLEKVEVYNLREDVAEQHDLAKAMPEKTRQLLDMLHRWQRDIGALLPQPNPDYAPRED
ncbi:MAG: sulfatase [Candidatus Hydrogenedentes bacterium]|nr:sulfatase [Candidatus Hydrogenedentota bacterium]